MAGAVTDTADTPATPGCMTWAVTADVQSWVDGTSNDGWRVSDSVESSSTKRISKFRTSEDGAVPADQPRLRVNFVAP